MGIAYQRQNVLMTVRASSVHGMSSKKKTFALLCFFPVLCSVPFLCSFPVLCSCAFPVLCSVSFLCSALFLFCPALFLSCALLCSFPVEHSYGHWIDLDMPHGRFPLWQLLRQYPEVAHPQCRDIAPLRLVSRVSCEVPARIQQVLNQLMILFGAVTPASSNDSRDRSPAVRCDCQWGALLGYDKGRIRRVTIGGNTCPTEEVCRLMVSFLQRLPLPRLVHFLDMILSQMVPVQSPCHSRQRRFASSYRVEERLARGEQEVEYPLNVCKLFWSRSDIMHVAITWTPP